MSTDRPYFNFGTQQLADRLESARGDLSELRLIEAELLRRKTKYAGHLLPRVAEFIAVAMLMEAVKPRPPLPVLQMIDTMAAKDLKTLLDKAKDGRIPDPVNARSVRDAIEKECERRGGRVEDLEDFFNWPRVDAPLGTGELSGTGWLEEGLLSHLGYSVSEGAGLTDVSRRKVLDRVFSISIPGIAPRTYLDQWGQANSAVRLRKMANSIAAFSRNAKRRSQPPRQAVRKWDADLEYLRVKYYVGRFRFEWPGSEV